MICALILVLIALELGLRSLSSNLSGNIQHIRQIPDIASRLGQQPASTLFLGNSLTNNGIEPAVFRSSPAARPPGLVEKIVPDGTALADWFCIFHNHIANVNHPPRVVVLGFAWLQLSDQYPINASRLGGYFCSMADLAPLSDTGLTHHSKILDFLAGAGSHVYLNREAIRNRVLDVVVPAYRPITQAININPGAAATSAADKQIRYTYETLRRLDQLVHDAGARLVLVAMPVRTDYPIDTGLLDVARDRGITLLDMRHTAGLSSAMYLDPIHLNEAGKHRFSTALALALTNPAPH